MRLRLCPITLAIVTLLSACRSSDAASVNDVVQPSVTTYPTATRPTATPRVAVAVRIDVTPGAQRPAFDDQEDATNSANMTLTETKQLIEAMPKVGAPAPDFSLRATDGATITLSALRGHPVVINFWALWCVPCRTEAPELQSMYEQFGAQGLVILGVNDALSDTRDNAEKFVAEFRLGYPIPLDDAGKASEAFRVPGIPTTFFVDAHGVIRQVIMGQLSQADLREGIALIKTW